MPGGRPPTPIPYPLSTFPGANPQESAGRLINCTAEPLGEPSKPSGPSPQVWRRQPGVSQFNLQQTGQSGYRGGLLAAGVSYECWSGNASTLDQAGDYASLGAFPGTKKVSIARNQAANPDVVAVDLDNGAFILNTSALASASIAVTLGGTVYQNGDTITILISNTGIQNFPVNITTTVATGDTPTTVAGKFATAINANATLSGASISATSAAAVLTIRQAGAIGNATFLLSSQTFVGTGNETVTFTPSTGQLSGGTGTAGIVFTGAPLAYNALGALPQPNSVCFQDGYFFFTTGAGQCFATGTNNLTLNGLSYINVVSKSDVTLLRAIPFSGLLWLFTTGNCEIWQDTAQPFPGFPYSRLLPIEYGLVQANAIAGWETGFSELLWVAQDFGVYWATVGTTQPIKVSPPDLDRLIEAEVRKGNTLEASAYIIAGKKFWVLSSPDWSWEFNIGSRKWNERQSLTPTNQIWNGVGAPPGTYGRWRVTGGHPAFGKWLCGDIQSGNMLFVDDQNFTETGVPQLFRIESGPVRNFPSQLRIARADFDFDMGVGQYVGNLIMTVLGAAAQGGAGTPVVLQVNTTAGVSTGDTGYVSNVGGTTEANGTHTLTVMDKTHLLLQGSVFAHTFTGGGTVVDVTAPPQMVAPQCAISVSKDGGTNWGNPLLRQLGQSGHVKRSRASVKNMGLSGPQGSRWRVDVTDPVYVGFLGATQSSDPREVGL